MLFAKTEFWLPSYPEIDGAEKLKLKRPVHGLDWLGAGSIEEKVDRSKDDPSEAFIFKSSVSHLVSNGVTE